MNQDYASNERELAEQQLRERAEQLAERTGSTVKIVSAVSELPLLRAVIELIETEQPDLLMLGSDAYSEAGGSFVAGSLIALAKASPIRVLIVPAHYRYRPVHSALVPIDFNLVGTLERLNTLQKAPQWSDMKLLLLHIDPREKHLRPDEKFTAAENDLHHYLQNFQHEIFYDNDKNVINGIFRFIGNNPVDLIIALPGNRSFLYALTHKSISEAIYKNALQPVLILK